MEFTIERMEQNWSYLDEQRNLVSQPGFAFIDKLGHCIIIVYGEGRKNHMEKHLSGDTNELGLKYKYVELK